MSHGARICHAHHGGMSLSARVSACVGVGVWVWVWVGVGVSVCVGGWVYVRVRQDYARVFSSLGVPACLWRRTGEICKLNKEFAVLVDIPFERFEFKDPASAICIYEVGACAGEKRMHTACVRACVRQAPRPSMRGHT
jgi:hypothetical protein